MIYPTSDMLALQANGTLMVRIGGWARLFQFFSLYEEIPSDIDKNWDRFKLPLAEKPMGNTDYVIIDTENVIENKSHTENVIEDTDYAIEDTDYAIEDTENVIYMWLEAN